MPIRLRSGPDAPSVAAAPSRHGPRPTPAIRLQRRAGLTSRIVMVVICASSSGCCWLWPGRHGERRPSASPLFAFTRIELQRLGCLSGDCPVYTVVLHSDGTVDYRGYAHVAVGGAHRGKADPAALRRLQIQLDDPDVFWLHARYTPGHRPCGAWSMNDSVARVTIETPNFEKHINHYLGCHGAPRLLGRIEQDIDAAAGVRRWVAREQGLPGYPTHPH